MAVRVRSVGAACARVAESVRLTGAGCGAQKQAERRAAGIKPKPSGGRKKKDDFEMFRILDDDAALSLPRSGPVPAAVALARPSGGKKRPAKPVIGGARAARLM